MTNGMRLMIESSLYDGTVAVRFEHDTRGVVVEVCAESLADAVEAAISQFKEMQDAAVEELIKYGLVRFQSMMPAAKGEAS